MREHYEPKPHSLIDVACTYKIRYTVENDVPNGVIRIRILGDQSRQNKLENYEIGMGATTVITGGFTYDKDGNGIIPISLQDFSGYSRIDRLHILIGGPISGIK